MTNRDPASLPVVRDSRRRRAFEATVDGARDNADWLAHLRPTSPEYIAAVDDLYDLLLAASRFEVARHQGALTDFERYGFAERAATTALRQILSCLGQFHGQSDFTTWASKFALTQTAKDVRCHAWHGRPIFFEPASWSLVATADAQPSQETIERLTALREAIDYDLGGRQRDLLVATAIHAVPIDVVAERLGTSRGAVYESIHEARKALRAALAERGLGLDQYTEIESS